MFFRRRRLAIIGSALIFGSSFSLNANTLEWRTQLVAGGILSFGLGALGTYKESNLLMSAAWYTGVFYPGLSMTIDGLRRVPLYKPVVQPLILSSVAVFNGFVFGDHIRKSVEKNRFKN